jgi:hypothetical protein
MKATRPARPESVSHSRTFPTPVHEGSASVWHLVEILPWLETKGTYVLDASLFEVSRVAMHVSSQPSGSVRTVCEAEPQDKINETVRLATHQLREPLGSGQACAMRLHPYRCVTPRMA